MMFGGLMTWALTGKPPTQMLDYFFPKTGAKKDDGSDERLSTPYYTREYFMVLERMRKDGVIGGTEHYFTSKLNPVLQPVQELWQNKDFYVYEVRDPNSPILDQAYQVAKFIGEEAMPISIASGLQSKASRIAKITSYAGFNPAPAYITRSTMQNDIVNLYAKRFGGGEKPYSKRLEMEAKQAIREAEKNGDTAKAQELAREAEMNHFLTTKQLRYMQRTEKEPGDVFMWKRLPESDKVALWNKMSAEDKKRYPMPKSLVSQVPAIPIPE
jgi:hypothetical protein